MKKKGAAKSRPIISSRGQNAHGIAGSINGRGTDATQRRQRYKYFRRGQELGKDFDNLITAIQSHYRIPGIYLLTRADQHDIHTWLTETSRRHMESIPKKYRADYLKGYSHSLKITLTK